jgi:hypothetical protein
MSDPLKPPASVLIKLGSIAVHVEEFFSPHGHHYDKTALDQLLADPEVQEWRKAMAKMAFLPVKRNP